jgi:hypothetical protein
MAELPFYVQEKASTHHIGVLSPAFLVMILQKQ